MKQHREKRSLDANAYAWVLITAIADELRASKDEIYFEMLKKYGQGELISVKTGIDINGFVKYSEVAGYGKVNGVEFTHYRVYKGSSEYDTRDEYLSFGNCRRSTRAWHRHENARRVGGNEIFMGEREMNNKQRYAILKKNKEQWLKYYSIKDESGIYILTRYDDNGFKFAYVGQAKKVLTRLAEHPMGYKQHIDFSLRKHGIGAPFVKDDKWKCEKVFYCPETELNDLEQEWIRKCHELGYQLLNKTTGSQGQGKQALGEQKPAKGYYDGIKQGRKKVIDEINNRLTKGDIRLVIECPNKRKEQHLAKLMEILGENNDEDTEHSGDC